MVHRFSSNTLIMLDGYFSNLFIAGLSCLLYEKVLRLPAGSAYHTVDKKIDANKINRKPNIVQLLNMDIMQEGAGMFKTLALLSATPLIMTILVVYLIVELNLAGLAGMLFIIPSLLVLVICGRFAIQSRTHYQNNQDARMSLLTELVLNIQDVKALGWESVFYDKIQKVRCQ